MKHTKFFIFALVAAMTFSACGTDDTLQFYYPENGGNTGGGAQAAIPVVNQLIRTIQTRMWLLPTCHKW